MHRSMKVGTPIVALTTILLGACSADLVPLPRSGDSTSTIDYCVEGGVGVSVKNTGNSNAAPSTMTVRFPVGAPVDIATPAVEEGQTADLPPIPIPAGCFTPDCGFKITADSHGEVPEGNENNNESTGICVG